MNRIDLLSGQGRKTRIALPGNIAQKVGSFTQLHSLQVGFGELPNIIKAIRAAGTQRRKGIALSEGSLIGNRGACSMPLENPSQH